MAFRKADKSDSLVDKILEDKELVASKIFHIDEVSSGHELADLAIRNIQHTYGIDIRHRYVNDEFVLHKELAQFHSLPKTRQEEILSGSPSDFKAIPRLVKDLKRIEKKELEKLNDEEKEIMKEKEMFLMYIIRGKPLARIVRDSLESNGIMKLTPKERKMAIKSEKDRLIKQWTPEKESLFDRLEKLGADPHEFLERFGINVEACERDYIDPEEAFYDKVGEMEHAIELLDTINEDMIFVAQTTIKYDDISCFHELADTAVNDIMRTYQIDICDDDDNFVLHKELVDELPEARQNQVLSGTRFNFKAIPRLLRALRKVEKTEFAKLNDEDKENMKEDDLFINYMIRDKHMAKIIRESEINGIMELTRKERRKAINAKEDHLYKLWSGDQDTIYECF
ncbi:hypothetical protein PENTCL1PPCAC_5952 [Pristionchus entomophagus]|uniref:Uncharacterized protein n=1 Tax=Pristionchus entomophagus TaxID=358040 RepID=A0AAV5SMJ7_9BILA|nr:hypothetical protein PENTCL1PPCAC_5952 [Pristionchus entomophagus]